MKRGHQSVSTHIGWRPDPELQRRWLIFLATQPPTNRTEYLNAMLVFYLDQVERYGLDPITLRPRAKK